MDAHCSIYPRDDSQSNQQLPHLTAERRMDAQSLFFEGCQHQRLSDCAKSCDRCERL